MPSQQELQQCAWRRSRPWSVLLFPALLLLACVHVSEQGKLLKLAGAAALLGGHRGFVPIPIPIHYGRRDDHHYHHHTPHYHHYSPHYHHYTPHHHHYPSYHHHHHHGHGGHYGGHGGWW
ncbi:uncharacterized protein LOC144160705 [Haemaphysalis longicornis]